MKALTLCADDYALDEAANEGILKLAHDGKINAISCMSSMPLWPGAANALTELPPQVDIGLHLNFTQGPHKLYSHHRLMIRAQLHLLNKRKIKCSIEMQLNNFIKHYGRAPDFIDGHQHVHHLPVIRTVLLEVYAQQLRAKHCYIRIASNGWWRALITPWHIKPLVIVATGAMALRRKLNRLHIAHNASFSGVYNFKNAKHYSKLFKKFLQQTKHKPALIMCHPANKVTHSDAFSKARYAEFEFLSSSTLNRFT